MNQKRAKLIRKEMGYKPTDEKSYVRDEKTGTIFCSKKRLAYQNAKKNWIRKGE